MRRDVPTSFEPNNVQIQKEIRLGKMRANLCIDNNIRKKMRTDIRRDISKEMCQNIPKV